MNISFNPETDKAHFTDKIEHIENMHAQISEEVQKAVLKEIDNA
jgi:hypothetical protein